MKSDSVILVGVFVETRVCMLIVPDRRLGLSAYFYLKIGF